MYRHILIATDGSELAGQAVMRGLALAKACGARVTAITVSDYFPTASGSLFPRPEDLDRYDSAAAATAKSVLDQVVREAAAMGVACETCHAVNQAPAEGILAMCDQLGCDLIVMSTHARRGLDRILLGSQAAKVVTLSKVSVLVAR